MRAFLAWLALAFSLAAGPLAAQTYIPPGGNASTGIATGTAPASGDYSIPLSAPATATANPVTLTFSASITGSTVNGSNALLFDPYTLYSVGTNPAAAGFVAGASLTGSGIPGSTTIINNSPATITPAKLFFLNAITLSQTPTQTNASATLTFTRTSTGSTTSGSSTITGLVTATGATSASSAAGVTTLTFASLPTGLSVGMNVSDGTTSAAINGTSTVIQIAGSGPVTVTLSKAVITPGVGNGDTINFLRPFAIGASVTGSGIPSGATVVAYAPSSQSVTLSANATASASGVTFTNSQALAGLPISTTNNVVNPNSGFTTPMTGDSVSGTGIQGGTTVSALYVSFPISANATATASGVTFTSAVTQTDAQTTNGVSSVTLPIADGPFYIANGATVSGSGITGGTTVNGNPGVIYIAATGGLAAPGGFNIQSSATNFNISSPCQTVTWGSCASPMTLLPNGELVWSHGQASAQPRLPGNFNVEFDEWSGSRNVLSQVPFIFAQWGPGNQAGQPGIVYWRSCANAPPDISGATTGTICPPGTNLGFDQFSADDGVLADQPNQAAGNVGVNVEPVSGFCAAASQANIPGEWYVSLHNSNAVGLQNVLEAHCNGDVAVRYGRLWIGNPASSTFTGVDSLANAYLTNGNFTGTILSLGQPPAFPLLGDGAVGAYAPVEASSANLETQSNAFANAAWTNTNVTVAGAAEASPDGTADASTLTSTLSSGKIVGANATIASNTTDTYTASAYIAVASLLTPPNAGPFVRLTIGATAYSATNITPGVTPTCTAGATCGVWLDPTGKWVRVWVSHLNTSQTTANVSLFPSNGSTGAADFFGAQLEKAAQPSSYIPTTAASVTRPAGINPALVNGAATGATGVTPAAGDASTKLATTAFLAAPGPIGGTTPAAITGTTITGSTINDSGLSASASTCSDGSKNLISCAYANNNGSPSNPSSTNGSTLVQMGLGLTGAGTITPTRTGKVLFIISGDVYNSTAIADGCTWRLSYGTGVAPSNGGAASGGVGGVQHYIAATTAEKAPFSIQWLATGLTVNTAYWQDLQLSNQTGGTCQLEQLNVSAAELP